MCYIIFLPSLMLRRFSLVRPFLRERGEGTGHETNVSVGWQAHNGYAFMFTCKPVQ